MINEKPQEPNTSPFPFPYYGYVEKNLTVSPLSEGTLTLTFSPGISWHNTMITVLFQGGSGYANIDPQTNSTALVKVWNYASSTSITGTVRVMGLFPYNVTMSLT